MELITLLFQILAEITPAVTVAVVIWLLFRFALLFVEDL